MMGNYFCDCHKNRQKHNQHFNLLYFKLNSHFVTSNSISPCKKFNLLLINSICLVVFSRVKKTHTKQSTLQIFLLCLERNDSQTFKTQQTQRCLFDIEKTFSQVAWKTPYFRSVLKDFSDLKKAPLRPLYWDFNMIKKRPLSLVWDVVCVVFYIACTDKDALKSLKMT